MKANYLLLTLFLLLESCASFKNELVKTGGEKEAIKNAILDFSNSSKLYKKDTVFSISFYNPLYKMVLEKTDDGNGRWIQGNPYNGLVAVNILADYNKLLLSNESKVGTKGKLPSRYIEKDGKLFFWWDDDYPLTKEMFDILEKYNLLQKDENGTIKIPDFTINDSQKGVDYYFCKNDLTNYKKITTNKGIGYYDLPIVKCND